MSTTYGTPGLIAARKLKWAGDIVSLNAGFKVQINPVQSGSGDPSPSNVRPISGWSTINLYGGTRLFNPSNYTVLVNASGYSGYILASDGRQFYSGSVTPRTIVFAISGGGTYYIKKPTATVLRVATYTSLNVNGGAPLNYIHNETPSADPISITASDSATYLAVQLFADSDTADLRSIEANINGLIVVKDVKTIPITIPTPPGTVYGGYIEVLEDGTARLVVTRVGVDMGSMSWVYASGGGGYYRSDSLTDMILSADAEVICSAYNRSYASSMSNVPNYGFAVSTVQPTVFFKDSSYGGDASAFTLGVTGQTICYTLATPVTYTIDPFVIPLISGPCNLWADSGDIKLTIAKQ